MHTEGPGMGAPPQAARPAHARAHACACTYLRKHTHPRCPRLFARLPAAQELNELPPSAATRRRHSGRPAGLAQSAEGAYRRPSLDDEGQEYAPAQQVGRVG